MKDSQDALERAARTIRRLTERLEQRDNAEEPIAIVGMACRFAHAPNLEAYWEVLAEGIDAVGPVPAQRRGDTALSHQGGYLSDVSGFDAGFFGISPREAETLDPQQRLILEVTWEALEHGGLVPDRLFETATGLFAGIALDDYREVVEAGGAQDTHAFTGTLRSLAAGRVSHVLGLRGPSLVVDTACSSSLAAIHLACQSLLRRDCPVALAGGVNLLLSQRTADSLGRLGVLAPDARCRTFDAAASGMVRGEGCGMLVLRRFRVVRRGDRGIVVDRSLNNGRCRNSRVCFGAQVACGWAPVPQGTHVRERDQHPFFTKPCQIRN